MEPTEFEAWGKVVVDVAAERILAAIPAAQKPEPGKTARRSLASMGYISRHMLFLQPDLLAPRALWLFVVPKGHTYDFRPPHDRVGAGLMHNATDELSPSRFAAGMQRSGNFTWKVHLDARYEGYRLGIRVTPEEEAAEAVAEDLSGQVLSSLERIGLLAPAG
ncbi:hypothetical protein OM076_18780 [Solirubrobacter ginsenosidimutans]|uniref:Uncharacterized protein n=1 Tax=Solirubrobacter ginsenosidimutans TaxID=490573 RepID=A0A9X3MTI4_9ACTN|nr:hypothetical protein [Solirubrobacter ginsenosidimutans]MDA0162324.1 hypothetical protein [Solirubrobacter ginsenosidimutans]